MFRWILSIFVIASINGCVLPVSSSCIDSQKYQNPEINYSPNTNKCDATDAAIYLIAATLKTLDDEDKKTKVGTQKAVKCSDMVGKSQKECVRKKKDLYDPLDEL